MRPASDLPRQRSFPRISGRAAIIVAVVLLLLVIVFGRALSQFYIDALWHDALGRSDVFWGQVRAKATLFVLFFSVFLLLAGVNLYFADRSAPVQFPANVHPYVERFHEVFGHRLRFIRYATAIVLAFILALPAVSHWQEWMLFRNSVPFGVARPAVRRRRRVLRVRAAVPLVRDRLAVRRPGDRAVADDGGAPAQRWCAVHFVDAHRAAGDTCALRRAAGAAGRGQSRRLLAHPLRAHQRESGVRAGRHVHGRQRPDPGADAVAADRPAHRRAVPVDDPVESLAVADRGLGAVAGHRPCRRLRLPGAGAVGDRAPQPR